MTLADFEQLYRTDIDPWSYETSAYEDAKYAATLDACGPGPFQQALELGSSIGVFSERLTRRCEHLTTVDGAATAVGAARRRLAGREDIDIVLGPLPAAIPARAYDLIVASEILYYLQPDALEATLERVRELAAASARLVAVHWRPTGEERPFTAREIHTMLEAQSWLCPVRSAHTGDYLLDAFTIR